tara:strand:+ start:417 stop:1307 length:891 start_codon:yes stop_codon:yes gene_type:complete
MSEEDYLRESGVGAIRAADALSNIINTANTDTDYRNESANISSVLQDMPEDRRKFVLNNIRPDGTLNSAAEAMLAPYADGRSEFQRDLARGIKSDPFFASAYADRFPLTNAMMNIPSTILENTGIGRLISAIGDQAKGAADFAGGLFPGAGATFSGIAEDLAAAPSGVAEDFTAMLGLKDDNPVKGEVRDILGVKKNTPGDMMESSDVFDMATEDRNKGIADANLLEGTPISQALRGSEDLSRFIDPSTGRVATEFGGNKVRDQFQGLNLGQFQNMIRDESGYFDRVIQQLGLGGR